jgi:hypothetical protein
MRGTRRMIHAAFIIFGALSLLLHPLHVHSQQVSAFSENGSAEFNFDRPNPSSLVRDIKPLNVNPFQRPTSTSRKAASDADSDSLSLQLDRKWTTALAQYAFAAPPELYSCARNQGSPSDWDSVVSGALNTYIGRSYTTYLRMSSDFEMQGQKREAGANGEPGTQTFTMEWELAHLVPSMLGQMEVAAGRYQQQLVSYAAFANSPLLSPFLGYSGSASGFETSVTLPDKDLTFSLRFGAEHLNATSYRSHATQFEFSWGW